MPRKYRTIIIDTNLWISYLISKNYIWIDDLIFEKNFRLIFSRELIDEFIEVAQRPKFKKYFSKHDIEKLIELFDTYGIYCKVVSNINLCRDSKDNFLLSLAKDSKADYLLTGDGDLLDIKKIGKTKILAASEFLNKK
jgi:putative PIN family toxin of toxin-antitoxin system